MTACSTPEQTQASQTLSTKEKKWVPLTKKLLTIDACYERGKSVLPKGVVLDMPTIHHGRPHAQEQLTKTKITSWFLCEFFLVTMFCFCVCLSFLVLLFFLFLERENSFVLGRTWREGKEYDQIVIYGKNFKIIESVGSYQPSFWVPSLTNSSEVMFPQPLQTFQPIWKANRGISRHTLILPDEKNGKFPLMIKYLVTL